MNSLSKSQKIAFIALLVAAVVLIAGGAFGVVNRTSASGEQMLSDMMARAAQAFERLPLLEDAPIMRNILYSGIWLRFENASERRKAKSEK